jgi:hypothetical protein
MRLVMNSLNSGCAAMMNTTNNFDDLEVAQNVICKICTALNSFLHLYFAPVAIIVMPDIV